MEGEQVSLQCLNRNRARENVRELVGGGRVLGRTMRDVRGIARLHSRQRAVDLEAFVRGDVCVESFLWTLHRKTQGKVSSEVQDDEVEELRVAKRRGSIGESTE